MSYTTHGAPAIPHAGAGWPGEQHLFAGPPVPCPVYATHTRLHPYTFVWRDWRWDGYRWVYVEVARAEVLLPVPV